MPATRQRAIMWANVGSGNMYRNRCVLILHWFHLRLRDRGSALEATEGTDADMGEKVGNACAESHI